MFWELFFWFSSVNILNSEIQRAINETNTRITAETLSAESVNENLNSDSSEEPDCRSRILVPLILNKSMNESTSDTMYIDSEKKAGIVTPDFLKVNSTMP